MNSNQVFINEAITNMITSYINSSDSSGLIVKYNFPQIVMNILVLIYGELDIINSYKTMNEKGLGGFDRNLMKFGLSKGRVQKFKDDFQKWYEIENKNQTTVFKIKNPYFVRVEMDLIDMFVLKHKQNMVTKEDIDFFEKHLFTDQSTNPFVKSYNLLYASNPHDVSVYWNFKKYQFQNEISYEPLKEGLLDQKIYDWFSVNESVIKELNQRQLNIINEQIYKYFNSSADDIEFASKAEGMMINNPRPKVKINY